MKTPVDSPASFTNFGDLLKFLRLRVQLTQRDLALAVGYHYAHLSRLENNQRLPDATTLKALFIPALQLEAESEWAERLLALAAEGAQGRGHNNFKIELMQRVIVRAVETAGARA